MAGLGRKVFTRERATSADVQGYLMDQTVMRFASGSARNAEISAPSEGMHTYLDDVNRVEFFDGAEWQDGKPYGSQDPLTTAGTQPVGTNTLSGVVFGASAPSRANNMTVTSTAASSRLIARVSGVYLVWGAVCFSSSSTGSDYRLARIQRNAVDVLGSTNSSRAGVANWRVPTVPVPVTLAVGDYVTLIGYHEQGDALNFLLNECFLSAQYMGR